MAVIEGLSARTPLSDGLPRPNGQVSFRKQWLAWLSEYLTPGYYDRKSAVDDAQWAYNHLSNGRMIVWLNEAAGEDSRIIHAAIVAMEDRGLPQTEARYARRILRWERAAGLLFQPKA
ncbi:hypothetical protein ACQR10_23720 [Bradyrhizobium sp. HKCCYLRH2060]|uniref:hypothetical protein n=1 Tax=Bradyrhizobium TaxID=374 RepID=UPI002915D525|nr:hypothetical protein [Bradyrhizobium sp. SZCCHNR3003]